MRSRNTTPYWIKTKFGGKCSRCGLGIKKGEDALYFPANKTLLCARDPCGKQHERDMRAEGFDIAVMKVVSYQCVAVLLLASAVLFGGYSLIKGSANHKSTSIIRSAFNQKSKPLFFWLPDSWLENNVSACREHEGLCFVIRRLYSVQIQRDKEIVVADVWGSQGNLLVGSGRQYDLFLNCKRLPRNPVGGFVADLGVYFLDSERIIRLVGEAEAKVNILRQIFNSTQSRPYLAPARRDLHINPLLHSSDLDVRLPPDLPQGSSSIEDTAKADEDQQKIGKILRRKETVEIALRVGLGPFALGGGAVLIYFAEGLSLGWRRRLLFLLGLILVAAGLAAFLFPVYWQPYCQQNPYC